MKQFLIKLWQILNMDMRYWDNSEWLLGSPKEKHPDGEFFHLKDCPCAGCKYGDTTHLMY